VNTEERQLTEVLHRITPEPPRRVTVEDIAFRLASQAGAGRPPRQPKKTSASAISSGARRAGSSMRAASSRYLSS